MSSGTTLCLTVSVPSGWSNTSVGAAGLCAQRDHRALAIGQADPPSWLDCPTLPLSRGSTSIGLRRWRLFTFDQRPVDADRNVPPQDFKRRFGFDVQRPRAGQRAFDSDFEQVGRTALELHLRVEVGKEIKRVELDQYVKADFALNAEAGCGCIQLQARAPNCTVLAVSAK